MKQRVPQAWKIAILALGIFLGVVLPRTARAGSYVVYVHGRNMRDWPSYALVYAPAGWQHMAATFNGSRRLNDESARTQVKSMLANFCAGGDKCVVVCFSAGCNRTLIAIDDLKRAGIKMPGLLWVAAAASAAGGSEIVNYTSKWEQRLLVKIFGRYSDIDKDLAPSNMRGATWGHIQNGSPAAWYEAAGGRNLCQSFLFWKVCGNEHLPGEQGDGVVPVHSACGYADDIAVSTCCSGAGKYTNRTQYQCPLFSENHPGMFAVNVIAATRVFSSRARGLDPASGPSSSPKPPCNLTKDDCDSALDPDSRSIPGILNLTPPDTDLDGKPDNCYAVDRFGCAHCRAFSIAELAYPSSCSIYTGTRTMGNYQENNGPPAAIQIVNGGSTVRFLGVAGAKTFRDMNLINGVTATLSVERSRSATCTPELAYAIDDTSASRQGNGIAFYYGCGQDDLRRDMWVKNVLTFHGATVMDSDYAAAGKGSGSTALWWGGNLLTYVDVSRPGGFLRKRWTTIAVVHPDDLVHEPPDAPAPGPPDAPAGWGNVYRFWSASGTDHFLTRSYEEGMRTGYAYEGVAFRVRTSSGSNLQPIYRCYMPGDHFVSNGAGCEGQELEGVYGWVSPTSTAAMPTALYRCRGPNDHLTTTNRQECIHAGYTVEGLQGFVP